jgi:hypothetical protein
LGADHDHPCHSTGCKDREVSCLPNLPIPLPFVRAEGAAQAGREKSWKIQEGMLKYGKSGSSDEGGSVSRSDDEEDDKEEEEEETQVLLN